MAALTSQLIPRSEPANEGDEQLLRLFWNRAELKKELDAAQNEAYHLAAQLKEEKAANLRVLARLQQVESMLANPATAVSATCFYQLRDVWNRCHERLETIARELSKIHHDKEYRVHVAGFRRDLYKSLSVIQRELNEVTQKGEQLNEEICQLRDQRRKRRGFWNLFRRRSLTATVNLKRAERQQITMRLGELTQEIQSRSSVEPPEFSGLDVEAKRSINLTVIAYAQEMFLHFADRDIAIKARDAAFRQVGDVRYGDRRDCREISQTVEEGVQALEADVGIRKRVHARVEFLRPVVQYRNDTDTVPIADSLGVIPRFNSDQKECGYISVNVLADEYWDVFSVLLT